MKYDELINKLENKRKLILKRLIYCAFLVVFTTIIGLLIDLENGFVFGMIFGIIITIVVVSTSYSTYKKEFKNNLMPLIILKSGLDLKYDYKDGVGENTVNYSRLFQIPDRYFKEDLIYGSLDDVRFMSSDVHMQEKQIVKSSDGKQRVEYVTYFKGRWFVFEFNKNFKGIIQVREDGIFSKPRGIKVQKIDLEDIEFNKKFNIYSTNQHDAFYVLTPTIMENIKKLESRFPGRIYFSFIDNQLHIAINNSKDSFEPPIFSPIDESFIEEMVSEILIIKDIINELRLNRKIFKLKED